MFDHLDVGAKVDGLGSRAHVDAFKYARKGCLGIVAGEWDRATLQPENSSRLGLVYVHGGRRAPDETVSLGCEK